MPQFVPSAKQQVTTGKPSRGTFVPSAKPAPVSAVPAKKGGGGFLHSLAKYSGAQLAGNLAKDVGSTAVGVGPGLYNLGKHGAEDVNAFVENTVTGARPSVSGASTGTHAKTGHLSADVKAIGKQYADYYGHNLGHHIYTHPLQPILDAATVLTGGAGGVVKVGEAAAKVSEESRLAGLAKFGERGTIKTRSPRNVATGKGPVHTDLTSTKPLVKVREQAAAKRAASPKRFGSEKLGAKTGGRIERRGGELQRYGKHIQAEANQHALGRLQHVEPYLKATRGLSSSEWTALHLRALDIHPDDLAELWKGTPGEAQLTSRVRALMLNPSKKMLKAEPEARSLSGAGAALYKQKGLLKDETAEARPSLTKRQASAKLGRPVRTLHENPYYFPHALEPPKTASPLRATGGGKAAPRLPGSTKENTGYLALSGKLHLRSDVLGPEFLRRVKFVKYDEVHNALRRGAIRVTRQQIEQQYGGKLPKGYEYLRQNASTRIPPTIRAEGNQHIPVHQLIPNPEDLHDSQLAKEGFSTTDINQAHQSGGRYYILPKTTVKAATGEFTRSSDFVHAFVRRPLQVWRAVVLGLRVGFLTNNLIGNSIMYTARTAGNGALRDLFGAIVESHGRDVAKRILDDPATPPKLRGDLYKEFFPEQIQGTFGRTQSPATSPAHLAGRRAAELGRSVTGAIPRVTSKVAEEYPRRALIRHFIRHSPEFKKVYQALPKQTRTFEEAARRVLAGEGPAYQRLISKQVNQALGDYTHLSPAERNVVRNAFPFYSWYRAIATTTYHLAADTPGRATALAMLGRLGNEQTNAQLGELPSFLKGAVGLGPGKGGTTKVLATQGLNPYATLEQLRSGGLADVGNLGLNPFLLAAADAYAKSQEAHRQGRGGASPGQIAGSALLSMLEGLPPSRVVHPMKPSKLYPNRNRHSELLGFLGAPVKEYSPAVAAKQARQGR